MQTRHSAFRPDPGTPAKPHRYAIHGALVALCMAMAAGAVQAQAVYRIVGPDGRVTFSDRPPATAEATQVAPLNPTSGANRSPDVAADTNLPASLKAVVRKYPVTLYTSTPCGPCDQGRALLKQRGVPFTEKTVNTNADLAALQKLAPNTGGLPLLMVGAQAIPGFLASEWNSYLDAADYPKTSALPSSYQAQPAQPLAPPKPVEPNSSASAPASGAAEPDASTPSTGAAQRRTRPVPPPKRADDNPAGIRF